MHMTILQHLSRIGRSRSTAPNTDSLLLVLWSYSVASIPRNSYLLLRFNAAPKFKSATQSFNLVSLVYIKSTFHEGSGHFSPESERYFAVVDGDLATPRVMMSTEHGKLDRTGVEMQHNIHRFVHLKSTKSKE